MKKVFKLSWDSKITTITELCNHYQKSRVYSLAPCSIKTPLSLVLFLRRAVCPAIIRKPLVRCWTLFISKALGKNRKSFFSLLYEECGFALKPPGRVARPFLKGPAICSQNVILCKCENPEVLYRFSRKLMRRCLLKILYESRFILETMWQGWQKLLYIALISLTKNVPSLWAIKI